MKIKSRLYNIPLYDSIQEEYFYQGTGEFVHFTNSQIEEYIRKLIRFNEEPIKFKEPLYELRKRYFFNKKVPIKIFFIAKNFLKRKSIFKL